jgi:branched-chain amino acid transport system substrate-binding protein
VLLIFNALGTPSNSAIQKYLNNHGVPQLFVATGATKFGNPKQFPWTMGWQPSYQAEGAVYARFLNQQHPDAKIAVLFQNDDFGRDLLKGFKDGLGTNVSRIVGEEAYEVTEPSIDSHVVKLKVSGADVLVNITTSKFAAQSLKKVAELNWKPVQVVDYISSSIGGVIRPAGVELAQGIFSAAYSKDPTDPQWQNDAGTKRFEAFMKAYFPGGNRSDSLVVYGYNVAQTLVQVLQQCGDDLTRANVMKQAANLDNFAPDMAAPGIRLKTTPMTTSP